MTLINFIYILSLVVWIGSIIFFSFFTAPAVFKTLGREQAGAVVGAIFPGYYRIGYICSILALATLWLSVQSFNDARLILLLLMAGATLIAGTVVGPKARGLKEEIKSQEDPEKKDALQAEFDKWHSVSVKLNSAVLVFGLALLWFTAEGLKL